MPGLADEFRNRAGEQRASAKQLLESPAFDTEEKVRFTALIGFVGADTLAALADLVDYLKISVPMDARQARRQEILKRGEEIRSTAAKAFSSGNWEAVDAITKQFAGATGDVPGAGS